MVFVTEKGAIKILKKNYNSTLIGDSMILRKSMILGIGMSILSKKKNVEIPTSILLYRWWLLIPTILFSTSLFTLLLKDGNSIENIGFGNLAFFLFFAYLVFKEVFV